MIALLAAAAAASAAAAVPAPNGPPGAALQATFKTIKQDGRIQLPAAAQADLIALLPPQRKGEECPDKALVAGDADALKDRGDGAVIVAEVTTCKGAHVLALSAGEPPRVASLLDLGEAESVQGIKALNLGGGKRETDLGIELLTSATVAELRLFSRADTGFAFADSGTLRDYDALRECSADSTEGKGWNSFVRSEKSQLAVLRIDATCDGGVWQASCALYRFAQGALDRAGVCNLPAKLDAKSLNKAGWK